MNKHILFINNSLVGGGAEKVLITILKNFDYTRFNVDLFLIHNEGIYLEDMPKEVTVSSLYSKFSSFRERVNYNLLSRFGIELGYRLSVGLKFIKKYDIIISFLEGETVKYHSYIRHKGRKNISWVHTDLYKFHYTLGCFFTEEQEKSAYAQMDEIVFVSNDAKKQFEKLYPDNITHKEVILNPIEKNSIEQYRKKYRRYIEDRGFYIVSVGRLSKEKGFDRLVVLAKRLKDDGYNFKINIIGEGELRKDLEKLISENHVEDEVSLVGFVTPPYEVMSNADLFISSSVAEGFSLVVAEAFCLGLPVVSTKTTGPIELIDNNKYGLLTEHDDESIYQAVKKMIDDDSLREYYHRKSLERAEIFDVKSVMNQIYSILD